MIHSHNIIILFIITIIYFLGVVEALNKNDYNNEDNYNRHYGQLVADQRDACDINLNTNKTNQESAPKASTSTNGEESTGTSLTIHYMYEMEYLKVYEDNPNSIISEMEHSLSNSVVVSTFPNCEYNPNSITSGDTGIDGNDGVIGISLGSNDIPKGKRLVILYVRVKTDFLQKFNFLFQKYIK